ncbi:hypothetical protein [Evansella tamaricis]|uniref:Uncharacterized protein n=1 Tax=Evansella tamaricis TaxID=2069301 RepID=A0ABS6JNW0_9BACI|nr:hypothetical protein [Evansella tamaricis]MBU9713993.1 hypothetical protein [Evansella tamaricis]
MKKLIYLFTPILLLTGAALPFLIWHFAEETKLRIAIIDKTVPDETYREHKGLVWLLNHEKIINPNNGEHYDESIDYFGFFPLEDKEYDIKEIPDDLGELDIIYIADTYGVFHDEYFGDNPTGERSEKIYGGITLDEIHTIKDYVYQYNTTLVAEFNSFGSPTSLDARAELTQLLSLDWTGWIGRYFPELDRSKSEEVPPWAVQLYESQYNHDWSFSGGGFILIHEDDTIVILEEDVHFGEEGITITFTPEGKEMFVLEESPRYDYWFDIIVPHEESQVLGNYQWDLTKEGEDLIDEFHIPSLFPAVITSTRLGFRSFYFAGDYVDTENIPSFYQMSGLATLNKWLSLERFFWETYTPMMQTILQMESNKETIVRTPVAFEDEIGFYTSRMGDQTFQFYQDGTWKDLPIKGINLGIAKPGTWPGEAAISEEEYYRWFQMIGEMNANAIRVYTLHPPGFYRALERYNSLHEEPLLLFHGMWIGEEGLEETLDAFDPENVEPFKEEIKHVIDAVHGNTHLPENPGHASGNYTADVSPYVIGWILGIEWYPEMVLQTNEIYNEIGDYDGKHVYTTGAEAFEYWLAEMFDYTMEYELETYQWSRPLSFTNWVTTDLLEHPSEPSLEEDLVGVDPNVIYLKDHLKTGQFASYHVYPYYPDFLNYDPEYLAFIDHRGENNSYAGYLNDLHEAHRIPVLIAEFGVPSSRGLTHKNPFGWNQGLLSEQEQGDINARLFEDIMEEGMLGGLVFAWHDEWFKRTWNTMELDSPYRRPYWSDAQTNEQNFGLLSFDSLKIPLKGDKDDWINSTTLYETDSETGQQSIRKLDMDFDERYLYIRLDLTNPLAENPFDTLNAFLFFDTIPGQGNSTFEIEGNEWIVEGGGIDFVLQLNGYDSSRLMVDSYYDLFYYQYGHELQMIPEVDYASERNNGVFHPIELVISKEMYIPTTDQVIPFESYETGLLRHGVADPALPDFNSLTDFHVNEKEGMIEIRLPWGLLNVRDPSEKEVAGDIWSDGFEASVFIDDIGVGALLINPKEEGDMLLDSLPLQNNGIIPSAEMKRFSWDKWGEVPQYIERLKPSYVILQELFRDY